MTSASVHSGGRSNHIPTSQAYDEDVAYYEQRPNVNQFYSDVPASSSGRLAPQHDQRQYQYSTSHSPQSQQVTSQDEYVLPYHTRSADSYDGPAPLPPPRTSSQQHQSSHSPSGRTSSRQPQQNTNTYGRTSPREKSDPPNAAAAAARSRRKNPSSPEAPQRSTSARDQPQQSQQAPAPLVREYSEVINRVVVSDPRVDEDRLQERVAEAQPHATDAELDLTGDLSPPPEDIPGPARRQDYSKSASRRKDVQFGDYVLGQTLGEGEFGKVKLGWKKDGSSQVAIKLIRRDSVQNHPGRLPKIYREISILRDLAHPNIVRLHEMVETERHIGIILEYASGGELFDYILNHRYLKDPAARRLFAQLVSGVGYLHKKGIVHRDLKLENLLLDQNRNIIITDFGFANTFDPIDVLGDEIEYNLTNKDYVRKLKLDNLDARGLRRGDLMQTSCGSPCYAAPELVVSDSLYTGRKVDVWSCGVILYAMLAGYLPFDDDPANPEGDNINLLYKYITTTPLTFPEYVSPHARDLLRRILVPDPRKRADLFEVARHSWLSEYHHVVSHITSSTTNIADIANSTVPSGSAPESGMHRSASMKEPSKPRPTQRELLPKTPEVEEHDQTSSGSRRTRHTLQAEYVAPQSHTNRGHDVAPVTAAEYARSRGDQKQTAHQQATTSKPLPQDPPRPPVNDKMGPPTRPGREVPRSVSDSTGAFATQSQYATPASTQGSITSQGQTRSDLRLPSRGSYGQPVAPTVATTNVQGRVSQPAKAPRGYNIGGPVSSPGPNQPYGQPANTDTMPAPVTQPKQQHHRRSSTLSGLGERLFGRSNSVRKKEDEKPKREKKYPPTSMKPMTTDGNGDYQPRMSTDSKRSFSFGLGKKKSTDLESQVEKPQGRRFSLLPASMSFGRLMGGKEQSEPQGQPQQMQESSSGWQSSRPGTQPSHSGSQPRPSYDGVQDQPRYNYSRPQQTQHQYSRPQQPSGQYSSPMSSPPQQQSDPYDVYGGTGVYNAQPQHQSQQPQGRTQHIRGASQPMAGYGSHQQQYASPPPTNNSRISMQQTRQQRGVLVKPNRKFTDAYDNESNHQHSGSSGAVRKVQDFFRRRSRAPRADGGDYR
jgi:protein-serine/threonine kinase